MEKVKKTKLFWLYFVVSVLTLGLGVVMLPVWQSTSLPFNKIGVEFVNYVIGGLIIAYVASYLIPKSKKHKGSFVQTLLVIEIVLMVVVAIGCILTNLKIINISNPCQILALALWLRGVSEVFCGVFQMKENKEYGVWRVIVAIAVITVSTYIFAKPLFDAIYVQWLVAIALILIAIALVVMGCQAKPKRVKGSK